MDNNLNLTIEELGNVAIEECGKIAMSVFISRIKERFNLQHLTDYEFGKLIEKLFNEELK